MPTLVTSAHRLAVGQFVTVTRQGVRQDWGRVQIVRLDRNSTYRLRFENDTYVTATESEVALAERS